MSTTSLSDSEISKMRVTRALSKRLASVERDVVPGTPKKGTVNKGVAVLPAIAETGGSTTGTPTTAGGPLSRRIADSRNSNIIDLTEENIALLNESNSLKLNGKTEENAKEVICARRTTRRTSLNELNDKVMPTTPRRNTRRSSITSEDSMNVSSKPVRANRKSILPDDTNKVNTVFEDDEPNEEIPIRVTRSKSNSPANTVPIRESPKIPSKLTTSLNASVEEVVNKELHVSSNDCHKDSSKVSTSETNLNASMSRRQTAAEYFLAEQNSLDEELAKNSVSQNLDETIERPPDVKSPLRIISKMNHIKSLSTSTPIHNASKLSNIKLDILAEQSPVLSKTATPTKTATPLKTNLSVNIPKVSEKTTPVKKLVSVTIALPKSSPIKIAVNKSLSAIEVAKNKTEETGFSKSWSQSVRSTANKAKRFIDGLGITRFTGQSPSSSPTTTVTAATRKISSVVDTDTDSDDDEEKEDMATYKNRSDLVDEEAMENNEDSMDSSERKYIADNEIPSHEIILGSEDSDDDGTDSIYGGSLIASEAELSDELLEGVGDDLTNGEAKEPLNKSRNQRTPHKKNQIVDNDSDGKESVDDDTNVKESLSDEDTRKIESNFDQVLKEVNASYSKSENDAKHDSSTEHSSDESENEPPEEVRYRSTSLLKFQGTKKVDAAGSKAISNSSDTSMQRQPKALPEPNGLDNVNGDDNVFESPKEKRSQSNKTPNKSISMKQKKSRNSSITPEMSLQVNSDENDTEAMTPKKKQRKSVDKINLVEESPKELAKTPKKDKSFNKSKNTTIVDDLIDFSATPSATKRSSDAGETKSVNVSFKSKRVSSVLNISTTDLPTENQVEKSDESNATSSSESEIEQIISSPPKKVSKFPQTDPKRSSMNSILMRCQEILNANKEQSLQHKHLHKKHKDSKVIRKEKKMKIREAAKLENELKETEHVIKKKGAKQKKQKPLVAESDDPRISTNSDSTKANKKEKSSSQSAVTKNEKIKKKKKIDANRLPDDFLATIAKELTAHPKAKKSNKKKNLKPSTDVVETVETVSEMENSQPPDDTVSKAKQTKKIKNRLSNSVDTASVESEKISKTEKHMFVEEQLTPPPNHGSKFRESAITPVSLPFKVSPLTPNVAKKAAKRLAINIEEPKHSVDKLEWTTSGQFEIHPLAVDKTKKRLPHIDDVSTEFTVVALQPANKKQKYRDENGSGSASASEFKRKALNSKSANRVPSSTIIKQGQKQKASTKFGKL